MSMSRFFVTPVPAALPGHCVVCGSVGGDGRMFVDFGFDMDYYGKVYFCSFCIAECARSIGFISNQEALETTRLLGESDKKLREVLDECTNLRIAIDALTATGYSSAGDDYNAGEVSSDSDEASASSVDGSSEPSDVTGSEDVQRSVLDDDIDSIINF